MASPFPGMDPFLEAADLWPEVHSRLIVALADALSTLLLPKYYVAIEKRTYLNTPEDSVLIGVPDAIVLGNPTPSTPGQPRSTVTAPPAPQPQTVTLPVSEEVQERYLEIRETSTARVITLIEVLSPKNKRPGPGRQAYLRKRQQVLASATHLVEIDLLRQGSPMPLQTTAPPSHYRILVSDSQLRPQAALYTFNLPDTIPTFALPLPPDQSSPQVHLKDLLDGLYDRAGYQYRLPQDPTQLDGLSPADKDWVCQVLAHQPNLPT